MKNRLTTTQQTIRQALPNYTDLFRHGDERRIEAWMRNTHGNLDTLTAAQFAAAALVGWQAVRAQGRALADALATSLEVPDLDPAYTAAVAAGDRYYRQPFVRARGRQQQGR